VKRDRETIEQIEEIEKRSVQSISQLMLDLACLPLTPVCSVIIMSVVNFNWILFWYW